MNRSLKLWAVRSTACVEPVSPLKQMETELELENILVANPELLEPNLRLVGRQTPASDGWLDLLAVDADGRLVIYELKRGRLGRDAVTQALDYASALDDMGLTELSQQMLREEIREFFYAEGLIHFDETPCRKFSLESDLDNENWVLFRQRAKIPENMEPEIALRNLHLTGEDGHMTQAGAWLLAQDIRKFQISADLACGLFMGTTKTRILDRRGFHSDVYSMIDDAVAWILSKINIEYIIKKVKREERPELPEDAIREAVVNAVAHRNYRSTASVHVYLFKDRLEIVSPGGLPAGMTEAELGIKSVPRNPLLFSMLHRMEAVENIGSGIRRIRDLCREHGVAEPVIDVSEHWVTTTFFRPTEQVEDQVGTKSGLSQDQVEILRKSLSEQPITELMVLAKRTNRTKFRDQVLRPLLEVGLLEMTIPDKPRSSKQKYRLTTKGRDLLAELDEE